MSGWMADPNFTSNAVGLGGATNASPFISPNGGASQVGTGQQKGQFNTGGYTVAGTDQTQQPVDMSSMAAKLLAMVQGAKTGTSGSNNIGQTLSQVLGTLNVTQPTFGNTPATTAQTTGTFAAGQPSATNNGYSAPPASNPYYVATPQVYQPTAAQSSSGLQTTLANLLAQMASQYGGS